MADVKIEQGVLLQVVTDDFAVGSGSVNRSMQFGGRKVLLKKGEIIMIHHPYAWHFVTLFGEMMVADEDYILQHCVPFGKATDVFELRGKINLQQIMDWHFWSNKGFDGSVDFTDELRDMIDDAFTQQYEKELVFIKRRQESRRKS